MQYRIGVDLSGIAAQAVQQLQGVFPLVRQAVGAIAAEASNRWRQSVFDAHLWAGEKNAYVDSIRWRFDGDLAAVVETDYANAGPIETGRPAFDQKRYLQTSAKVRRAVSGKHKGQRYLVVPMRHNTPGMTAHARPMPAHVYELASAMEASRVIGKTLRVSGQVSEGNAGRWQAVAASRLKGGRAAALSRFLVPQHLYAWGDRLPAGLVPKLNARHATDPYAGMVRFDARTPGQRSQYSQYLTFRVMGEWSGGWIIPAKPGLFLARGVAEQLQPLAEQALQEAMRRTLSST